MDGVAPERAAPPTAEPVCPRHPDRISYVRCQRCERPACPDCQRPAPVGVQCVDCVREQATNHPVPRKAFGGRSGTGRPMATLALIGACVAIFALQFVAPLDLTQRFAFAPALAASEPWRFLTSAFLHQTGFLPHILFNMLALWVLGPMVELHLGRLRFLALYLLSAVGGSVGYLALADPANPQSWYGAVVGASGAVFGLFGALLLLNRRLGLRSSGLVTIIAINAVIGFIPGLNIAWQAHLGGLVTGTLAGAALVYAPRSRRSLVQWSGLAAILLLLVAVSILKLASA